MALMVVSMSLTATGIYDPNNTVSGPDEKVQGDLKTTVAPLSGGTDYSLDFMQMDGRCGAVDVDAVSVSSRELFPAKNTVNVEGVFQTSHPNHNLSTRVEKLGEDRYRLIVEAVETSEIAPRCIGNINYHAHFTAPENSTLEIYHNESKMAETQLFEEKQDHPDGSDKPESNQEARPQGALDSFLSRLTGFF